MSKITIQFTAAPSETRFFKTYTPEELSRIPLAQALQFKYWITKKGQCCYPKDMCDFHLRNTLRMLRRYFQQQLMVRLDMIPSGEYAMMAYDDEFNNVLNTTWLKEARQYKIFRLLECEVDKRKISWK